MATITASERAVVAPATGARGDNGVKTVLYLVAAVLSLLIFVVPLAWALGMLNTQAAVLFFLAAFGYGVLLSIIAIVVDEITYQSYGNWKDLSALFAAAFLENVGFRQLHALWRLQGLWRGLRMANAEWGEMPRVGFTDAGARA